MKIDTIRLSKEMNDTLIHRACVMRSGQYLSTYLVHNNRSIDAIRLLGRCSVHDISKIQNTEEFISLASIIDEIGQMADVDHVQTRKQVDAKKLHWMHNSHHPEYYESPNDMSELDLLEMACDCHARSKQMGTDLIEFIDRQQEIRFKFDNEHFRKLRNYCVALNELTKHDDYSSVLNMELPVNFGLRDTTVAMLERFDESCYTNYVNTERLYMRKENNPDFASIVYSIHLKEENTDIGHAIIKCNGFVECKIFENYLGNGYYQEALEKIMEMSSMEQLFMMIRKDNIGAMEVVERVGFEYLNQDENNVTYRFKRPNLKLEKIPS